MPRLKNISGDKLHIGRSDGPQVGPGDVLAVDGEVLAELEDAYVIGAPGDDEVFDPETKDRIGFAGDARTWAKSTWELIAELAPRKGDS